MKGLQHNCHDEDHRTQQEVAGQIFHQYPTRSSRTVQPATSNNMSSQYADKKLISKTNGRYMFD
jgi:hypothetical protein